MLWLHHVARGGRPAERVLLVAPPSPTGVPDVLAPFFPTPDVALDNARLVCAENDPYCPEGAASVFPGLPTDLLPGQGHVNPDAGYGPGPPSRRGPGGRHATHSKAVTSSRIAPG